jgi:hypothetical protein
MYRPGMFPPHLPSFVRWGLYCLMVATIATKWVWDSSRLPLRARDWVLYCDIHVVSAIRLRSFPNLRNPRSFNDQIRWLMLFDQKESLPALVDKIQVRDAVRELVGEKHLVPVTNIGSFDQLVPTLKSGEGFIKCSHDSGSASFFSSCSDEDVQRLRLKYERHLSKKYGVGKGEWPYGLVEPRLFIESCLPGPERGVSPTDYKVHCAGGVAKVVQVVANRQKNPAGGLFLPDGRDLGFNIRDDRIYVSNKPSKSDISRVVTVAEVLARGHRYVRVDLYVIGSNVVFGELTFYPESGLYPGGGHRKVASLMEIDCTSPNQSVYDSRRAVIAH